MSWSNAWVRGLLVFLYFVVATVVVPNFVARLGFVQDASRMLSDLIVTAVWGGGLLAGLWLLRRLQAGGVI
jgi:hypothetical protein